MVHYRHYSLECDRTHIEQETSGDDVISNIWRTIYAPSLTFTALERLKKQRFLICCWQIGLIKCLKSKITNKNKFVLQQREGRWCEMIMASNLRHLLSFICSALVEHFVYAKIDFWRQLWRRRFGVSLLQIGTFLVNFLDNFYHYPLFND